MKQVVQKLRDGVIRVLDVPPPRLDRGQLLVRNHYSLISSGTEGSTVQTARKGYIGKAKERPQQVKQVFDVLRQQGPMQTYHAVMKKLDSYSPMGYSSAGVVLEVAPDVTGFLPGDKVACAGVGYANHAEVVAVPVNLCVKLPPAADLRLAATGTLGAIAMQGLRQADLRLGESCAVIGLGLLGQITCQLLRAQGVKVLGLDIDPRAVALAEKHSADRALLVSDSGLLAAAMELNGGFLLDAVIITAAASNNEPINLAGRLLRLKGKVVVVGNVPTDFERDTFYKKELDLRMSMSYGPGRYDPSYEEKGRDYPAAYVRWTENRNMAAYQELIYSGAMNIDYIISHTFKVGEAAKAYDLILGRKEPSLGVLLDYDAPLAAGAGLAPRVELSAPRPRALINVGFIGAGSYAQGSLLPNLPKARDIRLVGVVTKSGTSSRSVGDKYGFEFCSGAEDDVLSHPEVNLLFVATRHDSHADYVARALRAGKNVFVEKPLCTTPEELAAIEAAYTAAPQKPLLMVGFNRRFAPLVQELRQHLRPGPMTMLYRINAGAMPAENWFQDSAQGGRVLGEIGHFIDLMTYLSGAVPVSVKAHGLMSRGTPQDSVALVVSFSNGALGTIAYYANGSKRLPKEYLEVHKGGLSAVLSDFKTLTLYEAEKTHTKRLLAQDKGQAEMLKRLFEAARGGIAAPIPFNELLAVHRAGFALQDDLRAADELAKRG